MRGLLVAALVVSAGAGCRQGERSSSHPYAVHEEVTEPIVFAGGAITTTNGIAFSDEGNVLYISNPIEKTFDNGRSYSAIFRCRFESGEWAEPEPMGWKSDIDAYHPVLSADGERLFFNSRSHPERRNEYLPHNIWTSQKTPGGWSEPEMLEGVSSPGYDSYPSLTRGNDLYFNSDRAGGEGGMDLYVSRFVAGSYQEPVNLRRLNSADAENDLVVDPDERFIIFNRYIESTREVDLFIAFREEGNWSSPRKLDRISLPGRWELTPSLSPDGRYFFFEVDHRIMQVDARVVTGW